MALAGHTPLWIPRNQSSILRATHRATPRERSLVAQAGKLPSWKWLFTSGDPARQKYRYHHGFHAARWINDGNPLRLSRSRHPHIFDARTRSDWRNFRRLAEQKFWLARDIGHLRGHATNRLRDE